MWVSVVMGALWRGKSRSTVRREPHRLVATSAERKLSALSGRSSRDGRRVPARSRGPPGHRHPPCPALPRQGARHRRRVCGRGRVLRPVGVPHHRIAHPGARAHRRHRPQGVLHPPRAAHPARGHRSAGDHDGVCLVPDGAAGPAARGRRCRGLSAVGGQHPLCGRGHGLLRHGSCAVSCHPLLVAGRGGAVLPAVARRADPGHAQPPSARCRGHRPRGACAHLIRGRLPPHGRRPGLGVLLAAHACLAVGPGRPDRRGRRARGAPPPADRCAAGLGWACGRAGLTLRHHARHALPGAGRAPAHPWQCRRHCGWRAAVVRGPAAGHRAAPVPGAHLLLAVSGPLAHPGAAGGHAGDWAAAAARGSPWAGRALRCGGLGELPAG